VKGSKRVEVQFGNFKLAYHKCKHVGTSIFVSNLLKVVANPSNKCQPRNSQRNAPIDLLTIGIFALLSKV